MDYKKQEILFKNVTTYNKNNYKQFVEFHNKKYSLSYNFYTIIMTLLLVYCVILNIMQKNLKFLFMFLALLIVFLFFRLYIPTKKYQKEQKQYSKNQKDNFTFLFYKNYFLLDESTFYYFKLYKVFETKDYFYLYINDDNAAMVSKNGFKIGTVEDFSKFIKKKCFLSYHKQA